MRFHEILPLAEARRKPVPFAGREFSPEFMTWFGRSRVVDGQGLPQVVYHGTHHDFDSFHPGSHFGTLRAAHDRLSFKKSFNGVRQGSRVHPVYLRIERPIILTGRESDQEASEEARLRRSVIAGKYPQYPELTRWAEDWRVRLADLPYDGIFYENAMEDQGMVSYIVFGADQVRSAFDV